MKLLTAQDIQASAEAGANPAVLAVANDADVQTLDLAGVERIELTFPKFADGRAFSQAFELRRHRGFAGVIRATGDVLVDQLVQMKRCGFSEAVLRADQDPAVGQKLLQHYNGFYQGDATDLQPRFAKTA
ncbi:DUF934 domain-containing protein [Malikia sp.]|uniref:DUF934 domain-containing protein n=1 Tax=Malikia sp. TaxID=2070706 RepID=UPI0026145147|nr:DUF934 domain-containing protein [Malikia sp.]MDD2728736.1 DUF934 domain-containing protein [Malikia sp.]